MKNKVNYTVNLFCFEYQYLHLFHRALPIEFLMFSGANFDTKYYEHLISFLTMFEP